MIRRNCASWLAIFALFACACTEGTDKNATSSRTTSKSHAGAGGVGNQPAQNPSTAGSLSDIGGSAGSAGMVGSGGAIGCAAPIDLGVKFVGRVDGCEADAVRFAWSGSGYVAAFNGTGLSVHMRGKANQFTVIADGELLPTLVTQDGDQTYLLTSALPTGEHQVEVYRRTEASFGPTSVVGFTVADGQLSSVPAASARLIEVVGDSISCGYGDEGTAPCSFTADTENHYLSYGALLAREVGAELSTVAWSGKGVASNFQGNKMDLIPQIYERAIPTEKRSIWGFVPQPQLVIINLGTNDFSTNFDPSETEFVTAYQDLLAKIRSHYPSAYVLCTVGPMLSGADLTAKARPFIAEAVQARRTAGDTNVEAYEMVTLNPDPACDSHPNLLTHAAMATELAAKVKPILGW
jgi:lysophospholipase L1-like esterase